MQHKFIASYEKRIQQLKISNVNIAGQLAMQKKRSFINVLKRYVRDKDSLIRVLAAFKLVRLQRPDIEKFLINAFKMEKEAPVKYAFAQLLPLDLQKKFAEKIALARAASKYADEIERNVKRVFAAAETKDWLLYFGDADKLFENVKNKLSQLPRTDNIFKPQLCLL